MIPISAFCSRYAVVNFCSFFACFTALIYKQKLMPIKNIGNANNTLTVLVAIKKEAPKLVCRPLDKLKPAKTGEKGIERFLSVQSISTYVRAFNALSQFFIDFIDKYCLSAGKVYSLALVGGAA